MEAQLNTTGGEWLDALTGRIIGPRLDLHRAVVQGGLSVAILAHHGQVRKSGEPFVTHPVAVGKLLAGWGANTSGVVAGLLHDTVEDTGLSLHAISHRFGPSVAELVKAVSKGGSDPCSPIMDIARHYVRRGSLWGASLFERQALLIKIADRAHNIMTLGGLVPWRRRRCIEETIRVLHPIAGSLGLTVFGEVLR